MAFALVSNGSVSTTPGFGATTTAGNLLVAWVIIGSNSASACSDGTWVLGPESHGNQIAAAIWYKKNCGAGETAPTFGASPSTSGVNALLAQFSGGDTVAPLDQSGGNNGATSPVTATAAAADTASGELLIVCENELESKAGTTTTSVSSNNATLTTLASIDATSSIQHYRLAYSLSTTSNSAADNGQGSSTTMNLTGIAMAVASFKLASAVVVRHRNPAINLNDPAFF